MLQISDFWNLLFFFCVVLKKAFKIWSGANALPEMYNFMDIL